MFYVAMLLLLLFCFVFWGQGVRRSVWGVLHLNVALVVKGKHIEFFSFYPQRSPVLVTPMEIWLFSRPVESGHTKEQLKQYIFYRNDPDLKPRIQTEHRLVNSLLDNDSSLLIGLLVFLFISTRLLLNSLGSGCYCVIGHCLCPVLITHEIWTSRNNGHSFFYCFKMGLYNFMRDQKKSQLLLYYQMWEIQPGLAIKIGLFSPFFYVYFSSVFLVLFLTVSWWGR